MEWPTPLIRGTLIQRYKRFLADIDLGDGQVITAHCANPGAMTGLKDPGLPAYLSTSDNPKRKLKYSLEVLEIDGKLVGINTAHPNKIVAQSITNRLIPELLGYDTLRREVKYGENSRIDIFLEHADKPRAFVEVKNVHLLRRPGLAEFPDSVTARGTKHLQELARMVEAGHRAVMFYLVQRTDCERFSLAEDIDQAYVEAFKAAQTAGVETLCYDCDISLSAIELGRRLPIEV